jgi:tetratricopeptide (TPR) repeat protein
MALMKIASNEASLGNFLQSIAIYDDVIARFRSEGDLQTQAYVAQAFVAKGSALRELGRHSEALRYFDEAAQQYSSASEPKVRVFAAHALSSASETLEDLGRIEDSVAIDNEIIRKFYSVDDPEAEEVLALALGKKGFKLNQLNRYSEANDVFDRLLARFGSETAPYIREQVAVALINKAIALDAIGNHDDELGVYNTLIKSFGKDKTSAFREKTALALYNKGLTLNSLRRYEEAAATFDEIIDRYRAETVLYLKEYVARALLNKADALNALGREEFFEEFDELVNLFGSANDEYLRLCVMTALDRKGVALGKTGRYEAAIAAYDEALERAKGIKGEAPPFREEQALALLGKGWSLRKLGRPGEALATYDNIINDFGGIDAPNEWVRTALYLKASVFSTLGRGSDAEAIYDVLIKKAELDPDPLLRFLASRGKIAKERPDESDLDTDNIIFLAQKRRRNNKFVSGAEEAYNKVIFVADDFAFGSRGRTSQTITGGQTEGFLVDADKADEILTLYSDAKKKLPKDRRAILAAGIRHLIAREMSDVAPRPKWSAVRENPKSELSALPAPMFLKRVYRDVIGPEGIVYKDIMRDIDSDLMSAVDTYVSQRSARNKDLGYAQGLHFVVSRPATNARPTTSRKRHSRTAALG